jgi:hypothetical protein
MIRKSEDLPESLEAISKYGFLRQLLNRRTSRTWVLSGPFEYLRIRKGISPDRCNSIRGFFLPMPEIGRPSIF